MPAGSAETGWALSEELGRCLAYSTKDRRLFSRAGHGWFGDYFGQAALDNTITPTERSSASSVRVRPNTRIDPTVIEFVVSSCTELSIGVKLDPAAKGAIALRLEHIAGGITATLLSESLLVNAEIDRHIHVPGDGTIRLVVAQGVLPLVNQNAGIRCTDSIALHIFGNGTIAEIPTSAFAELVPASTDVVDSAPAGASRIEARAGYDTLFINGRPAFSVAAKGIADGMHDQVQMVGCDIFYIEDTTNERELWTPDERLEGDLLKVIDANILACDESGLAYQTLSFDAHCNPYLPTWAMERYDLYQERYDNAGGNVRSKQRPGGGFNCCFLKPMTRRVHLDMVRALASRYRGRSMIYTVAAEADIFSWNCECASCVSAWRSWLELRFRGDFPSFTDYVGDVQAKDFYSVPYLHWDVSTDDFGLPMRALYLRTRFAVESYCRYANEIALAIKKSDASAMVCQRGSTWSNALTLSKEATTDYSYAFAHLNYDKENRYGIGAKSWYGIYGHFAVLPTPKRGSLGKIWSKEVRNTVLTPEEWRLNIYTMLANGACGAEFQPMLDGWAWGKGSSLFDKEYGLREQGHRFLAAIDEVRAFSPRLLHFEHDAKIAVFHNGIASDRTMMSTTSESKVGGYGMLRELGYQFDALTEQDIDAGKLRQYRVLLLAGDLSLAPEVQAAIRMFVSDDGFLIASFDPRGQGLPGCNSFDYAGPEAKSVERASFSNPVSVDHLGDVLGIMSAGGGCQDSQLSIESAYDEPLAIDLTDVVSCLAGRSGDRIPVSIQEMSPAPGARVVGWFDRQHGGRRPGVVVNDYGRGRALTIGFCIGLVAANTYNPGVFAWMDQVLSAAGCSKRAWAVATSVPVGTDVKQRYEWRVEVGVWHDDLEMRTLVLVNHDQGLENEGRVYLVSNNGRYDLFSGDNLVDPGAGVCSSPYKLDPWGAEVRCSLGYVDSEFEAEIFCATSETSLHLAVRSAESCQLKFTSARPIAAVAAPVGTGQTTIHADGRSVSFPVLGGETTDVVLTYAEE